MKITFTQTSGTIDKDYPKTTKGYTFEIADAVVKRDMQSGIFIEKYSFYRVIVIISV